MRNIDYDIPREIFEDSRERFADSETGHNIAVTKAVMYGKERDIMVAYIYEEGRVKLLTIHPLKERQKENRVKSGRWRKL
jgi:hypothetical protein